MDKIRVLRVIEYVGPRDAIEKQIANSMRDGTKEFKDIAIKITTVGDFPEVLDREVIDGTDS